MSNRAGPDVPQRDNFNEWWQCYEDQGLVDGLGAAEYQRAKQEWRATGEPSDVETWIFRWATLNNEITCQDPIIVEAPRN